MIERLAKYVSALGSPAQISTRPLFATVTVFVLVSVAIVVYILRLLRAPKGELGASGLGDPTSQQHFSTYHRWRRLFRSEALHHSGSRLSADSELEIFKAKYYGLTKEHAALGKKLAGALSEQEKLAHEAESLRNENVKLFDLLDGLRKELSEAKQISADLDRELRHSLAQAERNLSERTREVDQMKQLLRICREKILALSTAAPKHEK